MNVFLINSMIQASAAEPDGKLDALVRAIGEHCAKVCEDHPQRAAGIIRQTFVYPTPTQTAVAAVMAAHKGH
jgi:hypothetical protein